MGDLSLNFSRSEFACKDNCGLDAIDRALVDTIQCSRTSTGLSYPINSGCRCENKNRSAGGASNSAHLLFTDGMCHAADIGCINSHDMYLKAWDLIRRFRRIEFGKKNGVLWIHVDNRRDLPQEVLILGV